MVNIRLILFFVYVKTCAIGLVCGQQIIVFNPNLDNQLLNTSVNNTAARSFNKPVAFINYRSRFGALSDVRDFYAAASAPIKSKHHLGIQAFSEQETSLFTKSKIALTYAVKIQLTPTVFASLGTTIGFASINFKSTGAGIGGSDNSLDLAGSAFINIKKRTHLGISLMQLTKSQLQPLEYNFILSRYFTVFGNHSIDLNPNWSLELGADGKINTDFVIWRINSKTAFNDDYGFLFSIGKKASYGLSGFLKVCKLKENSVHISAGYTNSYYPNIPGSSAYSISISLN